MGHYTPRPVEAHQLYRDMDHRVTRYVLTDGRLGRDVVRGELVLCFVYRPVAGLGEKATPGLTVSEVGRTTKIAVDRLQNPRLYQLIPPPYILRRPDGTETAVG